MTGPPKEGCGYKARKLAFRLDDDNEATNWVLHKKGCDTVRKSEEKEAIFRQRQASLLARTEGIRTWDLGRNGTLIEIPA